MRPFCRVVDWSAWLLPASGRHALLALRRVALLVLTGCLLYGVVAALFTAPAWWDSTDTKLRGAEIVSGAPKGTEVRVTGRAGGCTRTGGTNGASWVEECTFSLGGDPLRVRATFRRLDDYGGFTSCEATMPRGEGVAGCRATYLTISNRIHAQILADRFELTEADLRRLRRWHLAESMNESEWLQLGIRATAAVALGVATLTLASALRARAGLLVALPLTLLAGGASGAVAAVISFIAAAFTGSVD